MEMRVPTMSREISDFLSGLSDQDLGDMLYFVREIQDVRIDAAKAQADTAVGRHTALHHLFGRSPL